MSMDQGITMSHGKHAHISSLHHRQRPLVSRLGAEHGRSDGGSLHRAFHTKRWLVAVRGVMHIMIMEDYCSTRFVLPLLYSHLFCSCIRLYSAQIALPDKLQWYLRSCDVAVSRRHKNRCRRVLQSLGSASCCNITFLHFFLHMTSSVVFLSRHREHKLRFHAHSHWHVSRLCLSSL